MDLTARVPERARKEDDLEAALDPSLRASMRFPLSLPVRLLTSSRQYDAVTDNISASGVLFHLDELLAPGTEVEFLIEIPEGTIGPYQTAAVHCTGRIVRSYMERSTAFAAAVIDEYSFQ